MTTYVMKKTIVRELSYKDSSMVVVTIQQKLYVS